MVIMLHSAPLWCMVVQIMLIEQLQENPCHAKSARMSVSFPKDVYETLEKLAKNKKVSVAWVVRDAAEKYIADQWPLLESPPVK